MAEPVVFPECEYPEAHEAHMAMNGECPWCGAYDESQIEWPDGE